MDKFEMHLRQGNMADNTISAYQYAVRDFTKRHKEITKKNLLLYKTYLIETFKPKTVNLSSEQVSGVYWQAEDETQVSQGTAEIVP